MNNPAPSRAPGRRLVLTAVLLALVATQFAVAGHFHGQTENAACGLCMQFDRPNSPPATQADIQPAGSAATEPFPRQRCLHFIAETSELPPLRGPPAIQS